MHRVAVPQLFENMEEATIGQWLVRPGQLIAQGQPLCELITEKTTLELSAEAEGVLRALTVGEKAIVPTGFVIALIGAEDEPLPDVDAENAALKPQQSMTPAPLLAPVVAPAREDAAPTSTSSARLRATPAARRAAKVAGVSLEAVAEKFPGKVVSEDDVKTFAANDSGANAEDK